jgi:hypothetical protein
MCYSRIAVLAYGKSRSASTTALPCLICFKVADCEASPATTHGGRPRSPARFERVVHLALHSMDDSQALSPMDALHLHIRRILDLVLVDDTYFFYRRCSWLRSHRSQSSGLCRRVPRTWRGVFLRMAVRQDQQAQVDGSDCTSLPPYRANHITLCTFLGRQMVTLGSLDHHQRLCDRMLSGLQLLGPTEL